MGGVGRQISKTHFRMGRPPGPPFVRDWYCRPQRAEGPGGDPTVGLPTPSCNRRNPTRDHSPTWLLQTAMSLSSLQCPSPTNTSPPSSGLNSPSGLRRSCIAIPNALIPSLYRCISYVFSSVLSCYMCLLDCMLLLSPSDPARPKWPEFRLLYYSRHRQSRSIPPSQWHLDHVNARTSKSRHGGMQKEWNSRYSDT
ncbi:hypothetical protein BDM02DRAFT_2539662 [Thelephora ganbajun]|uniref:Uncharacterized protein n=1 Tax=Thelephora ganbajun TaxID=370292 RepID=A0ACB6ZDZ1_THEGA|nr:hypothetical protein BDM02DRAFT_2539662 [Thelephora ganbajun]